MFIYTWKWGVLCAPQEGIRRLESQCEWDLPWKELPMWGNVDSRIKAFCSHFTTRGSDGDHTLIIPNSVSSIYSGENAIAMAYWTLEFHVSEMNSARFWFSSETFPKPFKGSWRLSIWICSQGWTALIPMLQDHSVFGKLWWPKTALCKKWSRKVQLSVEPGWVPPQTTDIWGRFSFCYDPEILRFFSIFGQMGSDYTKDQIQQHMFGYNEFVDIIFTITYAQLG